MWCINACLVLPILLGLRGFATLFLFCKQTLIFLTSSTTWRPRTSEWRWWNTVTTCLLPPTVLLSMWRDPTRSLEWAHFFFPHTYSYLRKLEFCERHVFLSGEPFVWGVLSPSAERPMFGWRVVDSLTPSLLSDNRASVTVLRSTAPRFTPCPWPSTYWATRCCEVWMERDESGPGPNRLITWVRWHRWRAVPF